MGILSHRASAERTLVGQPGSENQEMPCTSERAGLCLFVMIPNRQRSTPSIELFSALDSKPEQMLLHLSQTHPGARTKISLPKE